MKITYDGKAGSFELTNSRQEKFVFPSVSVNLLRVEIPKINGTSTKISKAYTNSIRYSRISSESVEVTVKRREVTTSSSDELLESDTPSAWLEKSLSPPGDALEHMARPPKFLEANGELHEPPKKSQSPVKSPNVVEATVKTVQPQMNVPPCEKLVEPVVKPRKLAPKSLQPFRRTREPFEEAICPAIKPRRGRGRPRKILKKDESTENSTNGLTEQCENAGKLAQLSEAKAGTPEKSILIPSKPVEDPISTLGTVVKPAESFGKIAEQVQNLIESLFDHSSDSTPKRIQCASENVLNPFEYLTKSAQVSEVTTEAPVKAIQIPSQAVEAPVSTLGTVLKPTESVEKFADQSSNAAESVEDPHKSRPRRTRWNPKSPENPAKTIQSVLIPMKPPVKLTQTAAKSSDYPVKSVPSSIKIRHHRHRPPQTCKDDLKSPVNLTSRTNEPERPQTLLKPSGIVTKPIQIFAKPSQAHTKLKKPSINFQFIRGSAVRENEELIVVPKAAKLKNPFKIPRKAKTSPPVPDDNATSSPAKVFRRRDSPTVSQNLSHDDLDGINHRGFEDAKDQSNNENGKDSDGSDHQQEAVDQMEHQSLCSEVQNNAIRERTDEDDMDVLDLFADADDDLLF